MPGGLLLIWYYSADWGGCQYPFMAFTIEDVFHFTTLLALLFTTVEVRSDPHGSIAIILFPISCAKFISILIHLLYVEYTPARISTHDACCI